MSSLIHPLPSGGTDLIPSSHLNLGGNCLIKVPAHSKKEGSEPHGWLPPAYCFMLLALTLRGVIDRARLNDILLVVVDAIAVHVHTYFDFVLFAIANITRVEC